MIVCGNSQVAAVHLLTRGTARVLKGMCVHKCGRQANRQTDMHPDTQTQRRTETPMHAAINLWHCSSVKPAGCIKRRAASKRWSILSKMRRPVAPCICKMRRPVAPCICKMRRPVAPCICKMRRPVAPCNCKIHSFSKLDRIPGQHLAAGSSTWSRLQLNVVATYLC